MTDSRGFIVREEAIPFRVNELLDTVTTTATEQYISIPVYYTDWVELYITVADNDVSVDFQGDMSTSGVLPGLPLTVTAGTTIVRYVLVKGVPLTSSQTTGSHNLIITYKDAVSGSHGTISVRLRHHGIRRG